MTTDAGENQRKFEDLEREYSSKVEEAVTRASAAEGERDVAREQLTGVSAERDRLQTDLDAANGEIERLRAEAARVITTSGDRQAEDLSGLSAGEKIRAGIAARRGGGGG